MIVEHQSKQKKTYKNDFIMKQVGRLLDTAPTVLTRVGTGKRKRHGGVDLG